MNRMVNRVIAVLLSVVCFSCEEIEEDNYPVSARIDGVVYESKGGLLQIHDLIANLNQYEDGFSLLLSRTLYHGDDWLSLSVYMSPEGRWELNRRYPIVSNGASYETSIYRYNGDYFIDQFSKSGWLMLTDSTKTRFGKLQLSGEFEIVFEGQGDNEETILTEGRFNSVTFSYSEYSSEKPDFSYESVH